MLVLGSKNDEIFFPNVFPVHAQTIFEVIEIVVQFHCMSSVVPKRLVSKLPISVFRHVTWASTPEDNALILGSVSTTTSYHQQNLHCMSVIWIRSHFPHSFNTMTASW